MRGNHGFLRTKSPRVAVKLLGGGCLDRCYRAADTAATIRRSALGGKTLYARTRMRTRSPARAEITEAASPTLMAIEMFRYESS